MKLIKPHNVYPQFASMYKTILKTSRLKIVVQEFYTPHWLEFSIWKSGQKLGFYILDNVIRIPLNLKAYRLIRSGKVENYKISVKLYLRNKQKYRRR